MTNDGRTLVGTLHGFDQLQNCILTSSQERVFSADDEPQVPPVSLRTPVSFQPYLPYILPLYPPFDWTCVGVPCVLSLFSVICITTTDPTMTLSLTLITRTFTLILYSYTYAHSHSYSHMLLHTRPVPGPNTQVVDLGLYLLRGDNIAIVGELDTVLGAYNTADAAE